MTVRNAILIYVKRDSGSYRPWIWRRILLSALVSSIVPVTVISVLLFTLSDNGAIYSTDLSNQVRQELQDQFLLSTEAQADQISERLVKVGYNVELLRAYAQDLLTSQEAYARDPWQDPENKLDSLNGPEAGTAGQAAGTEGNAALDTSSVQYLENPIYYSKGSDGAIRKIIDDNGSVLFFRKPSSNRDFTQYERQKMQVTARLDPLLKGPTRYDQLVSHAYIVTADSMLRAYPFMDVSGWAADKDLTKPAMYAWSAEKANDRGLVWTSPYVSHLSGEWVVACLGQVAIGGDSGSQVAVVGCEVRVARMMDELLSFSIGPGGISWLQRGDGTLLSAQTSAVDYLRVIPIGNAELPSDKNPEQNVRDEANLASRGNDEIKALFASLEAGRSTGRVLNPPEEGRYFVCAPVEGLDWMLAGTIQSRSIALTHRQKQEQMAMSQQKVLIATLGLIIGVIVAFVMATLEGRRILLPVRILIGKLREYLSAGGTVTVAISDEGEIGELANMIQEVVDLSQPDERDKPAD